MSRNISLDILKLLMALMVVGLHAGFLGEFTSLGQYLTVNGVFRVAVPIFLIINGFYFYPVLSKSKQSSWLKRLIILYATWTVFYAFFWFTVPILSFDGFARLIKNIIIGYHHLWYLSGMIGAAIILIAVRELSSVMLVATALIAFITGVIIQYLGNYHVFTDSTIDELFNIHWIHRNMLFFAYPFFCIGYLINRHSLHQKMSLKLAWVLSACGFVALISESFVNYYQEGRDGGFDNFLSLIIVCPSIFILFMKSKISGAGKQLALYSSAIYFIHTFFLNNFRKYTDFEPTVLTFITILSSIFASYFIIKLNKKLKFIL